MVAAIIAVGCAAGRMRHHQRLPWQPGTYRSRPIRLKPYGTSESRCNLPVMHSRSPILASSDESGHCQGCSAAALRPAMRPNARHSPIFPVPWYR